MIYKAETRMRAAGFGSGFCCPSVPPSKPAPAAGRKSSPSPTPRNAQHRRMPHAARWAAWRVPTAYGAPGQKQLKKKKQVKKKTKKFSKRMLKKIWAM
jgi:hypothetical protein